MPEKDRITEKLRALRPEALEESCGMAERTTFRCGGSAAVYAEFSERETLAAAVRMLRSEGFPFLILGNGSNVLFRDGEWQGAVIKLGSGFRGIEVSGREIKAGAGAMLAAVSRAACEASLTGLEFACGIPGSVGGAVFMNAGAYEGSVSAALKSVTSMDADGRLAERPAESLEMGYRRSIFMDNGEIILSAVFSLENGEKSAVAAEMQRLTALRNEKQPVHLPSAGSFFKRPEGYFAGKLIQDAGLKGVSVGGAEVSPLHAGFIVNNGGATASDVIDLMKIVTETVYDSSGVMLEPEVRIIG